MAIGTSGGRSTEGHQIRGSDPYGGPVNSSEPTTGTGWYGKFITVADVTPWNWLTTPENDLWQGGTNDNNPCPAGFRLPKEAEWAAEVTSWGEGNHNALSAFNSPLKLVVGGWRYHRDGKKEEEGSGGYYWSRTTDGVDSDYLAFHVDNASEPTDGRRANGFSVRCIKD